jgi:protein-S-isoprenylcysteine O-methyltransferase Ste14
MEADEGQVRDLAVKLERGEISSKEALKGLKERGLLEPERWEIIPWAIYFILWLPLNFMFSDQLPAIHFPLVIICISIVLSALGICLAVWATRMHYKRGGLNHDETVILIKDGPYSVMRHTEFAPMMLPTLLPIILSEYVPFTPLSVAAIIVMIVYIYYGVRMEEEKLDIPKWGDEYRQYMKEVPRFNFVVGLWRLRRRKRT